jgi:GNAT superfamily N-acetyltransferase
MQTSTDGLVIKRVTAENFEPFIGLVDKLAEFEKLAPPDHAAKARLRRDCLSDKPLYEAFIGLLNGEAVAYTICLSTYSSFLALPTLFLEDIFVLEEYRRQGVGQKMFDYCKGLAESRGCGRIEFTVLVWNKSAQDFYDKNGAKRLSDWYFYRLTKENF